MKSEAAITEDDSNIAARRRRLALEALLIAVVALIELGGTALAAQHQTGYGTFGLAGIALLTVSVAALPLRRRFPVAVLAVTLATTLAYWSLGYPRGPVFAALVVAFVQVVLSGRRFVALVALIVGFLSFPWLGYLVGRTPEPDLGGIIGLGAWLATLFSATELIRNRRERAREAERSRVESLLRRATDERLRIAQELHDVIAHSMSLINIRAGVALHLIDRDPEQAKNALATIKDVSKEGLVELRSILGVLRQVDETAPRAPTPTLQRLDELSERARASGVSVRLEIGGDLSTVPRNVDLAAYRIIQESLTNVARHSSRPNADVHLHIQAGRLLIDVVDQGSVMKTGSSLTSLGLGIAGMRERATSVGGELNAGPRAEGGFAVHASLPFGEPA